MLVKWNKKTAFVGAGLSLSIFVLLSFLLYLRSHTPKVEEDDDGELHIQSIPESKASVNIMSSDLQALSERYQRPSKDTPVPNRFSFQDFWNIRDEEPPVVNRKFKTPSEVIKAFFGMLESAANMAGYSGGCGSIGDGGAPYPYAYQLLTKETQNEISLDEFIQAFKGIGHMTFLKLYPAYIPPDTPPDIQYHMIEVEVITGKPVKEDIENFNYKEQISYFAYYYGLVTTQKTPEGYKIKKIDYLPEEFLCAPYHSWFYDSEAVVEIVYNNNLGLINQIDAVKKEGNTIVIYASGKGKRYRFEFIRLTNGHDILLHEYVYQRGNWIEINLLTDPWERFKLGSNSFAKE